MIGRQILHYNILEKLGEGGMGVVYKAHDTRLKRDVAIKFLPKYIAANDEERERFIIEARAAAALNHSNIATIHAIEESNDESPTNRGKLFIVMEYIEGQELKDVISQIPPGPPLGKGGTKSPFEGGAPGAGDVLPIDDVLNYAVQIAEGLQAAHNKGTVHRDIKSSNIMITDEGKIKIMDFGLAKVRGGAQVTKVGTTIGTAAYMSPEQARGEEADHRSDIWSFAVVLYEMLSGKLPFGGEYEQAVIYSILNENPKPINEERPDIPLDLQNIITNALQKNPEQRYQQAEELLSDLKQMVKGEERIQTSSSSKTKRSWKQSYLYTGIAIVAVVIVVAASFWPFGFANHTLDSIAVLPLENLSGDPAQDYFSDGMTEALITDLSKISALKVISRTSVMQYKGARKPLPEIAKELGVKAVIEGSILRDGNRVRITAQLIEAESDRHLWADSYERNLTDIFALQRDIAQAIVGQVKVALTPSEQQRLQDVQQIDPEAHDAYLKGIHHVTQYNPSDFLKGLDYFSQAVKIEPNFSPGYLGIVRACMGLIDIGGLPFSEIYPKAKTALEKALQLDNSLAEAHNARGYFKWIAEWDWAGAESAFQKSLKLNPNISTTYYNYAGFLISMDRREEALIMISKARTLDPLSPDINNDVGWINFCARRYDEAIREYKNNLELYPDYIMSHRELGWVYSKKSMFKEAIQSVQKAIALERSAYNLAQLADVYAMAGRKDDAHKILNELLSTRQTEYLAAYEFAMIYTNLGDFDKAFEWLEKSFKEHSGWPFFIKADPLAEPLHSDRRYVPFLRKLGLEP